MASDSPARLRVLIADGRSERMEQVATVVASLGHDVVARDTSLADVGAHTAAERTDLALVVLGESSERSLTQISSIVKEAACPVIAILDVEDAAFIKEAAKLGIFAYVVASESPEELQSAIDIVLRRFAEYHNLEGAFGRRAIAERAKGILMERHGVDEQGAFGMLRDHSRRTNRKIVDVAEAVLSSHRLLPSLRQGDEAEVDQTSSAKAGPEHEQAEIPRSP